MVSRNKHGARAMKCIKGVHKNVVIILRVSNEEAQKMVNNGWFYCPKHEWKTQVRHDR